MEVKEEILTPTPTLSTTPRAPLQAHIQERQLLEIVVDADPMADKIEEAMEMRKDHTWIKRPERISSTRSLLEAAEILGEEGDKLEIEVEEQMKNPMATQERTLKIAILEEIRLVVEVMRTPEVSRRPENRDMWMRMDRQDTPLLVEMLKTTPMEEEEREAVVALDLDTLTIDTRKLNEPDTLTDLLEATEAVVHPEMKAENIEKNPLERQCLEAMEEVVIMEMDVLMMMILDLINLIMIVNKVGIWWIGMEGVRLEFDSEVMMASEEEVRVVEEAAEVVATDSKMIEDGLKKRKSRIPPVEDVRLLVEIGIGTEKVQEETRNEARQETLDDSGTRRKTTSVDQRQV